MFNFFMAIIGMVLGCVVSVRLISLLIALINGMFDKAMAKVKFEEANNREN